MSISCARHFSLPHRDIYAAGMELDELRSLLAANIHFWSDVAGRALRLAGVSRGTPVSTQWGTKTTSRRMGMIKVYRHLEDDSLRPILVKPGIAQGRTDIELVCMFLYSLHHNIPHVLCCPCRFRRSTACCYLCY